MMLGGDQSESDKMRKAEERGVKRVVEMKDCRVRESLLSLDMTERDVMISDLELGLYLVTHNAFETAS